MTIPIWVEAVQYTTGLQPVLVQYTGHKIEKGPLAGTLLFHTTQAELAALSPEGTPEGYWSDDEVHQALVAHLAESGITAEIVKPEPPSDTPEGTGVIEP